MNKARASQTSEQQHKQCADPGARIQYYHADGWAGAREASPASGVGSQSFVDASACAIESLAKPAACSDHGTFPVPSWQHVVYSILRHTAWLRVDLK